MLSSQKKEIRQIQILLHIVQGTELGNSTGRDPGRRTQRLKQKGMQGPKSLRGEQQSARGSPEGRDDVCFHRVSSTLLQMGKPTTLW